MNPGFWRGKKVLITGHTGFQGTWISLWLQNLGAHLAGYALSPPTCPSLFEIAGAEEGLASWHGDIRDPTRLEECIKRHRPEIVIHLAAQSLVLQSYRDPSETFSTNVMGTLYLLEAVRRAEGVRVVLCVTSDKCYAPSQSGRPYEEADSLGGRDPYSASKAAAEVAIASYRSSYFSGGGDTVALASARSGNAVGGGDWAENRLVPDAIRALMRKLPIPVRSPHAVRPWQHVLEPLEGYLCLAERLWEKGEAFSEAWNFGPPAELSRPVSWVVDHLAALWGGGAWVLQEGHAERFEMDSLRINSAKAARRLGWNTRLSLEESLQWVVDWYRAFAVGQDMRGITLRQIEDYQKRCVL